ncbi:hypothetical protein SAMN05216459_108253 [Ensifer sp. OV372]|nr:hypothetical protein SAMN05216459_108253 [Ensifer sp. OV372]
MCAVSARIPVERRVLTIKVFGRKALPVSALAGTFHHKDQLPMNPDSRSRAFTLTAVRS